MSEGRDPDRLAALAAAAGADLLDLHADPWHHRAVLTLVGEQAARAVAAAAVARLDLRRHWGAHPRLGVVDVVPFVPLAGATMADAVDARDRFARWAADALGLPAYRYGSGRSLPEVRRLARRARLHPDEGRALPHPTAGVVTVGARAALVAYNLVLAVTDLRVARQVAAQVRSPRVRALGLAVGADVQVSTNLLEPGVVGPGEAYDAVAARVPVRRAELVGLLPAQALVRIPEQRWEQLDVDAERTIEARLARRRG